MTAPENPTARSADLATFAWRPETDPTSDPVVFHHAADYAGYAVLHVPPAFVGPARDVTLVRRDGTQYVAVELRLPVRALAEFGLHVAADRVGAVLRGLLAHLELDEVTS